MVNIMVVMAGVLLGVQTPAGLDVRGRVVDKESGEGLAGATVILKGADGKIRKYGQTDADGTFGFQLQAGPGWRLEATMMGYGRESLSLDSAEMPVRISIAPGPMLLREVTVRADRIREQGDTISYSVGSFAQQQDRTIGDVLRRMPGIDVAKSGKIQYQGKDINKFYIEGADMLGGKYGLAANDISHDDVGAVEVMENHQPMQVLSGISFSDQAAINLKLKKKAKATWTLRGAGAAGWSSQPHGALWSGEAFAMAVMPGFQTMLTLRGNNTGEDLANQTADFFATGRATDLSRYISVGLPDVPTLERRRTLFNTSALASVNFLWKSGGGEVRLQADYSMRRAQAEAWGSTTYFLGNTDRTIIERRHGTDRAHSLSASMAYERNAKTAFFNNTLKTNVDWYRIRVSNEGTIPCVQNASLPDYYISDHARLIKRFGGRHLLTFTGRLEWESLPQRLGVETQTGSAQQSVGNHAVYGDATAAYSLAVKGISIGLEGGAKIYRRRLTTELCGDVPADVATENRMRTDYFGVYAAPNGEYAIGRFVFKLDAPISLMRYTFGAAQAGRAEVCFSPSLNVNWKPGGHFEMNLRGGWGRQPMPLGIMHSGMILTDYRTASMGATEFHMRTSLHASANVAYRHARRGIFANAYAILARSRAPYVAAQQIEGDYVLNYYVDGAGGAKSAMAGATLGKTLDFMRGSVNVGASFSRRSAARVSQSRDVRSTATSWSATAALSGQPARMLSVDYRFEAGGSGLSVDGAAAAWLGRIHNELLLNLIAGRRWEWRVGADHYSNELAAGVWKQFVLLDTKLVFKPSRHLELAASLTNIFNRRTYSYKVYSDLSVYESSRKLRGREFLISITIRK